jgi:EpsI family protein
MASSLLRSSVFATLMGAAFVVASAWTPTHYIADDKPKVALEALFPKTFGDWEVDTTILPIPPAPDLQKVIDATYDQTLARTYRNSRGQRVMMSVAYGRNQHEGMNTHRPEVCYPAQGLPIVRAGKREAVIAQSTSIPVTRLVAAKDARNEPITYWVIVGDQNTTFGRAHKLATLSYGLKGKIPDGMLLRFSSIDANDSQAFAVQERFIEELLAGMTPTNRLAILGRPSPAP